MQSIKEKLQAIDNLKDSISKKPQLNDSEAKRLSEGFMLENTYHSNAIEGSTLTLHETSLVLLEGLTVDKKPLRDHLDAVGHKHAFEYVMGISKSKEPLSERDIKDIHSQVLMDDVQNRGRYRQAEIRGALDEPPPPVLIPDKMEKLLESYAADNRHPVEKIAQFHLDFEHIHPFIDGNGRTGRLLLNLELIKSGYAPVNVKFQDRERYISCFRDYAQTGKPDKFTELIAGYELAELEKLDNILEQKQQLL